MLQSPTVARWHFLFFCCLLIRCAVVERLRYGLHATKQAPSNEERQKAEDFVVDCVKAWKSYTLALLLFKYLYARGSEALTHQQPNCFTTPARLRTQAPEFSDDALLAAEAAGINTSTAREAIAHAATKILFQVSTIDEAAVVIFGRFVSKNECCTFECIDKKHFVDRVSD